MVVPMNLQSVGRVFEARWRVTRLYDSGTIDAELLTAKL